MVQARHKQVGHSHCEAIQAGPRLSSAQTILFQLSCDTMAQILQSYWNEDAAYSSATSFLATSWRKNCKDSGMRMQLILAQSELTNH